MKHILIIMIGRIAKVVLKLYIIRSKKKVFNSTNASNKMIF